MVTFGNIFLSYYTLELQTHVIPECSCRGSRKWLLTNIPDNQLSLKADRVYRKTSPFEVPPETRQAHPPLRENGLAET